MRKQSILVSALVLLTACISQATVIDNPGFEYDGIINDIKTTPPSFWTVNTNEFYMGGWVTSNWSSEGSYSLVLSSYPYATFSQGDYISVSQAFDLTGITDIIFDVRLDTTYNDPFDPDQRQAKVLLNGDTYWASTGTSPDIRGEYFDESIDVSALSGVYNLELRLESQVDGYTYINYLAYWDNLRAVPEPATILLLGLGAVISRKKR
ncbi:MAG: PEP-CTERM sorting domain-containing protein [Planctomycetota bacterium]|nr:MAG: PEP-CTERM sorting domain-containing protein [Planctomycetota bacterium]